MWFENADAYEAWCKTRPPYAAPRQHVGGEEGQLANWLNRNKYRYDRPPLTLQQQERLATLQEVPGARDTKWLGMAEAILAASLRDGRRPKQTTAMGVWLNNQ
jgi:hypothetical protein